MQIEAIGFIVLALGCISWMAGSGVAIYGFLLSNLFGAAGALILTSFGSANILPGHLMLGFIAASRCMNRTALHRAVQAISFPNAGFWLLLTALYAVCSAIFLPRLFAGMTDVFAVSRPQSEFAIVSLPLGPTSGNITQTVYFLGDVICFVIFYSYGSEPGLLVTVVRAIVACAAMNLAFVALDLATYWTHTEFLLTPIRNGNYRMLQDATVDGFKRIAGSFAEASGLAYSTLGWFAFTARLWLSGVWPRLTGSLSLLSLLALIFATSSTGYAGLFACTAMLLIASLVRVCLRPVPRTMFAAATLGPLLLLALIIAIRLYQPAWTVVQRLADTTVVNKMETASGRERSEWNRQAYTNFVDTRGFGAGVGSVRASSLPLAVLGNIGVPGALTYGMFFVLVLWPRRRSGAEFFPTACQSAARWACFAQLAGASVSASFIDLDLPFFVFAGLACAAPLPLPATACPPAAASRYRRQRWSIAQ